MDAHPLILALLGGNQSNDISVEEEAASWSGVIDEP